MIGKIFRNSIIKYGLASVIARGMAIISALVLTPLIIKKFGTSDYAIWFLTTLIPTIIAFPDLGISNGVVNRVAESVRKNGGLEEFLPKIIELEKLLIVLSTVWFVLGCIAIFFYTSRLPQASNAKIFESLILALIVFCSTVPPTIWTKVQLALEVGHQNIVWEAIGKLCSFLLSILVIFYYSDVRWLVLATLLPPAICLYLNAWQFTSSSLIPVASLPSRVKSRNKKLSAIIGENLETVRDGGYFTVVQIAFVIGFAVDNFLISYFLSIEAVSYSSVLRRPFDALPLVITLFSTALWPVFNRLQFEGSYRKSALLLSGLIAWSATAVILLSAVIIFWNLKIYSLLSSGQIIPKQEDLFWIALKTLAVTLTIILQNYIIAVGLVKRQAQIQIVSSLISLMAVVYFLYIKDLSSYFIASACIYTAMTFIPMLLVTFLHVRAKLRETH